jgi:hypothetical protein
MALTKRTQVLLDEERLRLLRERSTASGRSVGAIIRDAIDQLLDDEREAERAAAESRERALASFLAAEPMPVEDWPEMERELERAYERGP